MSNFADVKYSSKACKYKMLLPSERIMRRYAKLYFSPNDENVIKRQCVQEIQSSWGKPILGTGSKFAFVVQHHYNHTLNSVL